MPLQSLSVRVMSFKSDVRIELERMENGDLKIKFGNETLEDLVIRRSGLPKEKVGAEARKLLAASLAECMCSTLIFLLDWAKIDFKGFQASVDALTEKDEKGGLCVDSLNVTINVEVPTDEETTKKFRRVKSLFKRGCLMSRSLERGIKVNYSIVT